MPSRLDAIRCVAPLALSVTMASGALSAAQDHAPLPERLVTARTVYLVNDSGDLKVFDKFYQEVKEWNHFAVVTSRDDAEIVMVLTSNPGYVVSVVTGTVVPGGSVVGTAVSVPSEYLCLKVFSSATAEVLWSDKTEKWVTSGHAPSKLVSNLKKRMPKK
jgi:hypothetical protein